MARRESKAHKVPLRTSTNEWDEYSSVPVYHHHQRNGPFWFTNRTQSFDSDSHSMAVLAMENPQDPVGEQLLVQRYKQRFRWRTAASNESRHDPMDSYPTRRKPSRMLLYLRNRANASNVTVVGLGVLLAILSVHRVFSLYMTHRRWINAPITYMNRQCPAPSYPTIGAATATTDTMTGDDGALSRGAIPPAEIPIESSQICMTTLTDAKSTSRWQRFIRWRNFDGILELTHANKALYAHKHGYRFVDGSDWIDTSRPPAWSKIPAVQHLLQTNECEWVLWTDADTVIMNSDVRIQDFLPAAGSGKDLMVGSDNGGGYNSGVFLVRNTPWAQEFLQTWWDMRSFVRPSGLSLSGDNNAMKALLREMTDFNEHVLSPPRCTFNAFAKFLTLSESVHVLDHLDDQEWYLSENYYHKGDFIAHTPGYDNKAECLRMLLQEAR
jgi:hypothetical protein